MENNDKKLKITWEMAVDQFENLVKFAAKQEAQKGNLDAMMSAEDLYQIGMIKLYDCWEKWCYDRNKDMDEFGPIFRKSLFRAVRRRRARHSYVDLDEALYNIPDESSEDVVQTMYLEYGLNHLKEILDNDIAKDLLDELISPSEETVYEVWADRERKKMLKSQGKRVNIPKDNTVRMKHIIRSLGITTKQYDMAIAEIREKAPMVLELY